MTRPRIYGSDTAFCAWMRRQESLPSFSRECGFVALDNDLTIHRYLTGIQDSLGTRDIQSMLHLEVKTRDGDPTKSQRDTLRKKHLFRGEKKHRGQIVRWWGVYFLKMSGMSPDDSTSMQWGIFRHQSDIVSWRDIDRETLLKLLRFELHPGNLTSQPFRRHHLTREYSIEETTPLGFSVERIIQRRS